MDIVTYAILKKTKADLVDGLVPASELPSYVSEVIDVVNKAALPATGDKSKIYAITVGTGVYGDRRGSCYRWTGSQYILISDSEFYVELAKKQDKLVAGYGIKLTDDTTTQTTKIELGVHTFDLKGAKDYYADLPTSGQVEGDTWYVKNDDHDLTHLKGFYTWIEDGATKEWLKIDTTTQWGTIFGDITKQTDLMSELDKKVDKIISTTSDQAYIAKNGGIQGSMIVTSSLVGNSIVKRQSDKSILVPEVPTADTQATSKKYVDEVDNKKVDKLTSTSGLKAYIRNGSNDTSMDLVQSTTTANTIPVRGTNGVVKVGDAIDSKDAVNKGQVDIELDKKVDKIPGKGLSTNDLTDELKAQYDLAYTTHHTHTNKTILDNTTAAFTTEQKDQIIQNKNDIAAEKIARESGDTALENKKQNKLIAGKNIELVESGSKTIVNSIGEYITLTGSGGTITTDQLNAIINNPLIYIRHDDLIYHIMDRSDSMPNIIYFTCNYIDSSSVYTPKTIAIRKTDRIWVLKSFNPQDATYRDFNTFTVDTNHYPSSKLVKNKLDEKVDKETTTDDKTYAYAFDKTGEKVVDVSSLGKVKDVQVNDTTIVDTNGIAKIKLANDVVTDEPGTFTTAQVAFNLSKRISNLETQGRFLSYFNADDGTISTTPSSYPYVFKAGDYFIISTEGYKKPKNGVTQMTSATLEVETTTELGKKYDVYRYDGTGNWLHEAQAAVTFEAIAGEPEDNVKLKAALEKKQDKLTAGENITITESGVISSKDFETYYIELTGISGTLTAEQRATLLKGSPTNNFIDKDNMIFKCVYYKANNKAVYSISGESKVHVITVALPAGTWNLVTYELMQLLGKEAVSGEPYHFPYHFETKFEDGKIKITLYTITLDNNKTLKQYEKELDVSDLVKVEDVLENGTSIVDTADKKAKIVYDDTPTENSTRAVKSGSLFTALKGKVGVGNVADAQIWAGTKSQYDAIATKDEATLYYVLDDTTEIQGVMNFKGTCLFADLPTSGQQNGDYWVLMDTTGEHAGQAAIWSKDSSSWNFAGATITVDSSLSTTSTNAIQNKVVTAALNALKKADEKTIVINTDQKIETAVGGSEESSEKTLITVLKDGAVIDTNIHEIRDGGTHDVDSFVLGQKIFGTVTYNGVTTNIDSNATERTFTGLTSGTEYKFPEIYLANSPDYGNIYLGCYDGNLVLATAASDVGLVVGNLTLNLKTTGNTVSYIKHRFIPIDNGTIIINDASHISVNVASETEVENYVKGNIVSITDNIAGGVLKGPEEAVKGQTATVRIVPNSGFIYPQQIAITVTGATISSYDKGKLVLSSITGDIKITATCPIDA